MLVKQNLKLLGKTAHKTVVKVNDDSHTYHFQKGNLIHVTHITPSSCVFFVQKSFICSKGIQYADIICLLIDNVMSSFVGQTFVLLFLKLI